ncbi:MarC family protein [Psychrobacter sp. I-STPA10]|uniref:MarC family protein n=1 Tax=Psychrobacter sp. I-STPA10 TaxID=2585769 RepID=UPI001E4889E5|nr:MarC family protein [Psychrobacter sp. I-STPA10]
MDIVHQFGLVFMAFFAIMNPISSLPVYISLTADDDPQTAKAIARKGLILAFGITSIFALGGQYIFSLFGITLPALRLAGGSLVFLIGFHMLQGKTSPTKSTETTEVKNAINQASNDTNNDANNTIDIDKNKDNKTSPTTSTPMSQEKLNVAISPLATPLLAGPGTIATAMSLTAHHTLVDKLTTISAFGVLCIITYVLFLYSKSIVKIIGDNAMTVMTRMMGLILAVIGAQMLIAGLKGAFKVLA